MFRSTALNFHNFDNAAPIIDHLQVCYLFNLQSSSWISKTCLESHFNVFLGNSFKHLNIKREERFQDCYRAVCRVSD